MLVSAEPRPATQRATACPDPLAEVRAIVEQWDALLRSRNEQPGDCGNLLYAIRLAVFSQPK